MNLITDITDIYCNVQSGHTEGPKNVKDYPHKKKNIKKKRTKSRKII